MRCAVVPDSCNGPLEAMMQAVQSTWREPRTVIDQLCPIFFPQGRQH